MPMGIITIPPFMTRLNASSAVDVEFPEFNKESAVAVSF
jgi:hypothetical protein